MNVLFEWSVVLAAGKRRSTQFVVGQSPPEPTRSHPVIVMSGVAEVTTDGQVVAVHEPRRTTMFVNRAREVEVHVSSAATAKSDASIIVIDTLTAYLKTQEGMEKHAAHRADILEWRRDQGG